MTLSMMGARRLHALFESPHLRVVASEDAAPFVAKGGNVFAKHVLSVDEEIRAGEEVLVVDSQDRLLATGTAVLAPEEMLQIKRGWRWLPERLPSTDQTSFHFFISPIRRSRELVLSAIIYSLPRADMPLNLSTASAMHSAT